MFAPKMTSVRIFRPSDAINIRLTDFSNITVINLFSYIFQR